MAEVYKREAIVVFQGIKVRLNLIGSGGAVVIINLTNGEGVDLFSFEPVQVDDGGTLEIKGLKIEAVFTIEKI